MVLLGVLLPLLWGASVAIGVPVLHPLRVVETHETLGVPNDSGMVFPPGVGGLLSTDESSFAGRLQLLGDPDAGTSELPPVVLPDAILITLGADGRVLLLDADMHELTVLSPSGDTQRFDLSHLQLRDPRGLSVDPSTGHLYILDGDRRIVMERPDPHGSYRVASARSGRVADLTLPRGWVELRGLAFDPETGRLHVYSPQTRELFELDRRGEVEATRSLPEGEGDPRAMVFANSSDGTDAPERTSLYLAADGRRPPQTTEWSLHAPPTPPEVRVKSLRLIARSKLSSFKSQSLETVSSAGSNDPVLIRTIDAWRFNPSSPDSAGIAYIPASSSLLMADSEVNEMSLYQGVNMFELTPSGSLFRTWDTTAYSDEPTGVAYNPGNGHIYLSDDSADRVWVIDPRSGGVFGDGNDVVTSFSTRRFGSGDPEGVAYNPTNGCLYIVDGVNREVYEVNPGSDGKFDGQGDIVQNFDVLSLGTSDPEGIAVDSGTGNLYIVGKPSSEVREVLTSGTLVRVLDISAADPEKPAGLTFGPTSVDSTQASLYIAARGVDNGKDPFENDGEIYEFSLDDFDPGESNEAPMVVARSDAIVTVDESVSLDAAVSDDGLPDPPGAIESTNWTQDSGPALAQIDNPSTEDTTVSFPAMGSYVLRQTAFDGQLSGSDTVTFTVKGANGEVPVEVRVIASSDDAEERSGRVKTASRDLELTLEKLDHQTVGLRFRSVEIPRLAAIENAWIQFQAAEIHEDTTKLMIAAEATGDAATFLTAHGNITSRNTTAARVGWSPPPWLAAGEVGPAQRTTDISPVVQEVVDRDDWSAGNDLAIIITGTGKRVAEAYDGSSQDAPLLHVEYIDTREPSCSVGGEADFSIGGKGKELKWRITNSGDSTVTIDRLTIEWPEGVNGVLREVKLGKPKIFDQDVSSPALIDAFVGTVSERQLDSGEGHELKLKFANEMDPSPSAYSIQVEFAEGCSLNF